MKKEKCGVCRKEAVPFGFIDGVICCSLECYNKQESKRKINPVMKIKYREY